MRLAGGVFYYQPQTVLRCRIQQLVEHGVEVRALLQPFYRDSHPLMVRKPGDVVCREVVVVHLHFLKVDAGEERHYKVVFADAVKHRWLAVILLLQLNENVNYIVRLPEVVLNIVVIRLVAQLAELLLEGAALLKKKMYFPLYRHRQKESVNRTCPYTIFCMIYHLSTNRRYSRLFRSLARQSSRQTTSRPKTQWLSL